MYSFFFLLEFFPAFQKERIKRYLAGNRSSTTFYSIWCANCISVMIEILHVECCMIVWPCLSNNQAWIRWTAFFEPFNPRLRFCVLGVWKNSLSPVFVCNNVWLSDRAGRINRKFSSCIYRLDSYEKKKLVFQKQYRTLRALGLSVSL